MKENMKFRFSEAGKFIVQDSNHCINKIKFKKKIFFKKKRKVQPLKNGLCVYFKAPVFCCGSINSCSMCFLIYIYIYFKYNHNFEWKNKEFFFKVMRSCSPYK